MLAQLNPNMIAGDLWINNDENKLYFYDGTDPVPVDPPQSRSKVKLPTKPITMIDTAGRTSSACTVYTRYPVGIHMYNLRPRADDTLLPVRKR